MAENYEQKINESQNTLSTLMTAINRENLSLEEKVKERKSFEAETEKYLELTKSSKEEYEKYKSIESKAKEDALEAIGEANKILSNLEEIKLKKQNQEKELIEFVEKNNSEFSKLNVEKSDFIKKSNSDKEVIEKDIKLLEQSKLDLQDNIESINKKIEALLKEEIKENSKIEERKKVNDELSKIKETLEYEVSKLKNDVIDQQTIIDKNKVKIEDIKLSISEKEEEKEKLKKEIDILEQGRVEFTKAKIVLQHDREELTNRELFIMDKYELAGLPYNNQMLPTTKTYIVEKSELEQIKQDLDKREKFIKDKYKEAGVEYL